jgi:ferredoxin
MNVTRTKNRDIILGFLKDRKKVFLIGCGDCAASCRTGGEPELAAWTKDLEQSGFQVTGSVLPETSCDERLMGRILRENADAVGAADVILSLACGSGAGTMARLANRPVVQALDTLFTGVTERLGVFHEHCSLCGECLLNETAGLCAVTRCAKGLVNGPCGGAVDGRCETNNENECFWVALYRRDPSASVFHQSIGPRPSGRARKPRSVKGRP